MKENYGKIQLKDFMQKSKDHRNYILELKLKMFNGILNAKVNTTVDVYNLGNKETATKFEANQSLKQLTTLEPNQHPHQ